MANVRGKNVIKANIMGDSTPISANISLKSNKIKGNISGVPSATTEQKGIIRIATLEEVNEGLDNTTAVTPYTLQNAINSDKHYTHTQAVASDTWVINHNLNKKPSISIVDSADTEIFGFKAEYLDLNTVRISFNGGFTGKAYLN